MHVDAPLYLKHVLVRTPLEHPAQLLRELGKVPERRRHPEAREMQLEDARLVEGMRRVLRADSNFVDVGAHLGTFLVQALRLAPRGKHKAFEPVPRKARWLRRKFPEVEVYECALSDRVGPVPFFEHVDLPGYSGLHLPTPAGEVREGTVWCDRLDRLLAPEWKVDLIKIDVEGFELATLRGAEGLLRRQRPTILFESGPEEVDGLPRRELYRFLTELGYGVLLPVALLEANPSPLSPEAWENAHHYPFAALNYWALPPGGGTR